MPGLSVILKWHNLQSLHKALDLYIEFKFCESDFYFLNGSKNCMAATYNFCSVYIYHSPVEYNGMFRISFYYQWSFSGLHNKKSNWKNLQKDHKTTTFRCF